MRILSVVGNRPQFIKSGPLSVALRAAGLDEVVVHTGQHWDAEMSAVFFDELALPEPAYRLDLRTSEPAAMEPAISAAVERERPDWVLVYGDTNSTLAGAAAAGGVPVAHVEAGLRSFDLSMPEERNRIEVDRISALLLCPDERSAEQLAAEGVAGRREVVGDVMADATRLFLPIARERTPVARDEPYAALTLHRAANTEPERLRAIVRALNESSWTYVFPVHPRTRHVLDTHSIELGPNVQALEPLGYLEMLALVAGASRVVTDSGGPPEGGLLAAGSVRDAPREHRVGRHGRGRCEHARRPGLAGRPRGRARSRPLPGRRTSAVRRRPRVRAHRRAAQ